MKLFLACIAVTFLPFFIILLRFMRETVKKHEGFALVVATFTLMMIAFFVSGAVSAFVWGIYTFIHLKQ